MSQERLPIFPKKILPIPHNDTTLSFALEAIKQKESSMLSSSRKKKRNTFSLEIRRHPCGSPTSSPPTKKRSLGDGVIQTTTPNSHAATTNKMDWQSPDSNHAGAALPNSGSFASMLGLDFTPLFSNNTASPRPSMGGGSMTGAAHTPLTISMTPLTGIAHTPLTGAGHGFVSQGLPPTGTTPSQLPPDNRGKIRLEKTARSFCDSFNLLFDF